MKSIKRNLLFSGLLVGLSSNLMAAEKSISTQILESISSTSFSKVECSMEDYTCQKIIMEMGRQEAVSRIISGDQGPISVILQQSIAIRRQQDISLLSASDEEIISILAFEE